MFDEFFGFGRMVKEVRWKNFLFVSVSVNNVVRKPIGTIFGAFSNKSSVMINVSPSHKPSDG